MFGDISVFARPVVAPTPNGGPTFPLYLLPSFSLPFRRRRGSVSRPAQTRHATISQDSDPGDESPPRDKEAAPALAPSGSSRLTRAQPDTLRCSTCATDIAFVSQIVSKGFTGRHGRAYLVSPPSAVATPSCPGSPLNDALDAGSELVNIRVGRAENRQLVTGAHVVADIWCVVCSTKIGWKYVDAREAAQKYKVGKFILETQRVVTQHSWDDITDDDGVIVFDSEDEDECDDIFAGVWDPDVVAKRRRGKVTNMRRPGGAA
ncbi:yippee zinc-binding/DNA-binding /Mis18, centromere assembly-domain-containing protein [Lasiosphaeris hirsuta]|uniref:Yippee zinc-binding/DNA-binding /Mis18, centromere assembly-domain-containing protein n=1 Tax=Lasiosphaeris hirsuta TaxID=260670 RepID=A0AA40AS97_9PEZI|nr:yippee zinc-binding/DNA-binding /Mis18, centromere assembly-domain-containing protein [Lasiosphaeris hirsuta]